MDWKKVTTVPPPTYKDILICYKDLHPHGGDLIITAYLDVGEKDLGIWRNPTTNDVIEVSYKEPDYWCNIKYPEP